MGSSTSTSAVVVVPPPVTAPVIISATAADARVALAWTPVAGATAYQVFRSTTGVWEATPLARVTRTTFTNTGLLNGTQYAYRVAAATSGGAGPMSSAVTATPLAAPSGVVATGGDGKVTLTWQASIGASAYTVFRSTSSTVSTFTPLGGNVATTTMLDTGLTNGVRYYYYVRANAADGVSARSVVVSAKPQIPPPSTAPSNLVAKPGNAIVVLTWSSVANATGYRIFRATAGVWDSAPLAGVTTLTFKDRWLTNGVPYSYRVAARNAGGDGPLTDVVTATPLDPPPAPTGLSASAGDKTVTVSWSPVAGATGYNVHRGTEPDGEKPVPVAAGLVAASFADQPLANGPTYYYRVTALNAGGESPMSDEVNATPEGPIPPVDPLTLTVFRLLRQSTWGPRPGQVETVKAQGAAAFVAEQLSAPPSTFPSTLFSLPVEATQEHFMQLALTGPDQLRQRVAWALHKIWVVSAVEVDDASAIVTYYRLLHGGAFGNYRDLMRAMALNPAMGRYLNMLNNRSQDVTGVPPNENFARELMQLFTLGLTELDPFGAPLNDAQGQPKPTYTETDVKELARILTGWTFGDGNPAIAPRRLASENYRVPMEAVESYHDHGAKLFLGRTFNAGQTAAQDLEQALDVLFAHPNLGVFIGRQLIQQLVTSNPSRTYIADIAAVFSGNAGAARGDLGAVVQAILLHPEAGASTPTSGKLSEAVLFIVSQLRALNAVVTDHPFMSDMSDEMGQKVFYPPSVFSYVSPNYRVRGTGVPPLVGPEFQTLTSVTALVRVNFVTALLEGWFGTDVRIDYTPFTSLAGDPAALVDYVNTLLMGGRMSIEERTAIIAAVRATPSSDPDTRARTALFLTLVAAQAQVDR